MSDREAQPRLIGADGDGQEGAGERERNDMHRCAPLDSQPQQRAARTVVMTGKNGSSGDFKVRVSADDAFNPLSRSATHLGTSSMAF